MYSNSSQPPHQKLNEYLALEVAASETCKQAADQIQDDVVRDQLLICESSHRKRAQKLRNCIEELGVSLSEQPAAWNSFSALLTDGHLQDKDAVRLLEEQEEFGLKHYIDDRDSITDEDEFLQQLLHTTLVPEQENSHSTLSILKLSLQ